MWACVSVTMPPKPGSDRVLKHFTVTKSTQQNRSTSSFACKLCNATFSGSYGRARLHLAGTGGAVAPCPRIDAGEPGLSSLLLKEIADDDAAAAAKKKRLAEQKELDEESARRRQPGGSLAPGWARQVRSLSA